MTTPNMALTLPVVSQTPGPTWASEINADLSLIDSHNHTSGQGSLVPVAGLDINADLSLDTHALTDVTKVVLLNGASATNNSVYAVSGNLWWTNGGGTPVQITSGNAVNVGATGNIGGITGSASVDYVSPTLSFDFTDENGNPASLVGDVFVGSSATLSTSATIGTVTLTASGSGSYAINLPAALPVSSTSFLTCTTGGQLGYTSQANGITRQMQAAVGQVVASYQFDGPISSPGNLLLPVTITTTGRPVFVGVTTITTAPNAAGIRLNNTGAPAYTSATVAVNITSASPPVGFTAGNYLQVAIAGEISASGALIVPASSLSGIVVLPLGQYTLQCVLVAISGGGTPTVAMNGNLFAYEL